MPEFLSSLPFFLPISIRNYYTKNIHQQTARDLAWRISEFAAEQISFVLSQRTLHVYAEEYLDSL
jgi:hypothetical protein